MSQSQRFQRLALYIFCVLFISLSVFTAFGDRGLLHLWHLRGEQKKLDDANFRMEKENEKLRERIYRLRHDDLYLEQIAREELGLVRPGEIVYRFTSSDSKKNREPGVGEISSRLSPSSAQKPPP